MSDIESFHTDSNDTATTSKVRSKGKHNEYCIHFEDPSTAHDAIVSENGYLGYKWKLGRQVPSSNGSTHWYTCSVRGCCIKIQLKINTIADVSSVFMSDGDHTHDQQTRPKGNVFGIDEKIKTIIREYERLNLKPSLMLRKLRDDIPSNMTIPDERQLHNFLKVFRSTKELGGNLGNMICLNDFTELYEIHKEIPDNADQMFVTNSKSSSLIKKFGRTVNAAADGGINICSATTLLHWLAG